MVFLGGIEVFERADLHEEFFAAAALDLRDALHRLSRAFVGEVNAGLVLAAAVVALPVLHRGVDDIEVGQQRRTAGVFLISGQPTSAASACSMSFCSVSACFFSVMAPTMGSPTILPLRSTT